MNILIGTETKYNFLSLQNICQTRNRREFFQPDKRNLKKPTVNSILTDEILNIFLFGQKKDKEFCW